mmetsp:Transcript_14473/g.43216  ORF Transcript_14473/g.43216 Transcript_14473/m.43216 type:complete len:298 (-) Transcript_14473:25-918(-)
MRILCWLAPSMAAALRPSFVTSFRLGTRTSAPLPGRREAAALARRRRSRARLASAAATTEKADPRTLGLALELDDGTRKVHSVAENTAFVTGFFRGLGDVGSFSQLTASFYFVYRAMEEALDRTDNDVLKKLDFPELRRLPGLERDMAFYFGDDWRDTVEPSPATRAYVAQVEKAAESELLIGHLYSRYLGDLFGGQMMSGMAKKTLGSDVGGPAGGLSFYAFDAIDDTKGFISRWYEALNDLPLSADARSAIVDEANVVFRMNIALFDELEGNPYRSAFMLALRTLKERLFSRRGG